MKPAMLQLKHYHFNAVSLAARPQVTEFPYQDAGEMYPPLPAEALDPQLSLAEPDADDPREFVVKLKLEHDPDEDSDFPYSFLVEAEGLFEIDHNGELDERRRLVAVNGASILYSAMREHLLTLSARHRYGPILLPCLDFRYMKRQGELDASAESEG